MYRICSLLVVIYSCQTLGADILMATMGGTKSHKIPFWELAKGLIARCVQYYLLMNRYKIKKSQYMRDK